jgi:transmembrane protein
MSTLSSRHGGDTPPVIAKLLRSSITVWAARIALTLPYWFSGLDKLLHPYAALSEFQHTGLPGSWWMYGLLLVVQIGGSVLVIFNRYVWLGAGTLAVFTAAATYLAHAFWKLDGSARFAEMNVFMEHIALMAGFAFAALCAFVQPRRN